MSQLTPAGIYTSSFLLLLSSPPCQSTGTPKATDSPPSPVNLYFLIISLIIISSVFPRPPYSPPCHTCFPHPCIDHVSRLIDIGVAFRSTLPFSEHHRTSFDSTSFLSTLLLVTLVRWIPKLLRESINSSLYQWWLPHCYLAWCL